ncbi:hypothetical protein ACH9L7_19075 (plasmid) [Haloferax sp. S1W]|uniref:hypothetical protein n=1 Tax=Haloferax sp. S1W TaxID=3377110 RepID=UPI0037C6D13B
MQPYSRLMDKYDLITSNWDFLASAALPVRPEWFESGETVTSSKTSPQAAHQFVVTNLVDSKPHACVCPVFDAELLESFAEQASSDSQPDVVTPPGLAECGSEELDTLQAKVLSNPDVPLVGLFSMSESAAVCTYSTYGQVISAHVTSHEGLLQAISAYCQGLIDGAQTLLR